MTWKTLFFLHIFHVSLPVAAGNDADPSAGCTGALHRLWLRVGRREARQVTGHLSKKTMGNMEYHGISWNIMEYHGISWNIMEYHGISWNIMEYHGISWNIMEYHGISWKSRNIMGYHGNI